jgi:hypothetical protein
MAFIQDPRGAFFIGAFCTFFLFLQPSFAAPNQGESKLKINDLKSESSLVTSPELPERKSFSRKKIFLRASSI